MKRQSRSILTASVARLISLAVVLTATAEATANTSIENGHQIDDGNNTIRIGYLLQEYAPPYRVGAINLAIRHAKSRGLLPDYRIKFVCHFLTEVDLRSDNSLPLDEVIASRVVLVIVSGSDGRVGGNAFVAS